MALKTRFRGLGRSLLDTLFPPRCVGCGSGNTFLCGACIQRLIPAEGPRCPRCWQLARGPEGCRRCAERLLLLETLRSGFVYEGVARQCVLALKFRGLSTIAEPMAALLAERARGWPLVADLVVPVPLHRWRQAARGYNQATLLARGVAAGLGLPLRPGLLTRRRRTPPQARQQRVEDRRRHLEGAFATPHPEEVRGLQVLLVDDVATSGATLDSCAGALLAAGAAAVSAVTFARED